MLRRENQQMLKFTFVGEQVGWVGGKEKIWLRYWLDSRSINRKSDYQRKPGLCLLWDKLILGFSGTEKWVSGK